MAGYNTIRGLRVKYLSADPATSEDGQVWYNSTTGNLRVDGIILAGSWTAGGTMPTPRVNGGQGIGTKTAAAVFGGNTTSITYPYVNTTYEYDGSSWSGGGAMNNPGSGHGAFGPQTAGVKIGSYQYPPNASTTNVEEYNGSAWTAKSAMSVSRYQAGGAGTNTAGLAIGGVTKPGSPAVITTVEEYDGEGWTGGGAMPTARCNVASGGTQTAAIVAGGDGPPALSTTFEYDGSSWTAGGALNTARHSNFGNGGPTAQTEMLVTGGVPATATSELYNGTSWVIAPSLGSARNQQMNGQASNTGTNGAIVAGGTAPPTGVNTSETFTAETTVTKNITTS